MLYSLEHPIVKINIIEGNWCGTFGCLVTWQSETLGMIYDQREGVLYFAGRPEEAREVLLKLQKREDYDRYAAFQIAADETESIDNEFLTSTKLTDEQIRVIRSLSRRPL